MNAKPRWASYAEAALYSGMSERTIRRWVADKRLTGHRLGPRHVQVDLNEVDALRTPIATTTRQERSA